MTTALVLQRMSSYMQALHGGLLGTAELLLALHNAGSSLEAAAQRRAVALAPRLAAARLFRSRGGELLRAGVCRCDSMYRLPLPCDIMMEWNSSHDTFDRLDVFHHHESR